MTTLGFPLYSVTVILLNKLLAHWRGMFQAKATRLYMLNALNDKLIAGTLSRIMIGLIYKFVYAYSIFVR